MTELKTCEDIEEEMNKELCEEEMKIKLTLADKIQDEWGDRCCKVEDIKQAIKEIKEKIKKYIDYSSNMLDEDYLGIMSIIEEEIGKELYEEGK